MSEIWGSNVKLKIEVNIEKNKKKFKELYASLEQLTSTTFGTGNFTIKNGSKYMRYVHSFIEIHNWQKRTNSIQHKIKKH